MQKLGQANCNLDSNWLSGHNFTEYNYESVISSFQLVLDDFKSNCSNESISPYDFISEPSSALSTLMLDYESLIGIVETLFPTEDSKETLSSCLYEDSGSIVPLTLTALEANSTVCLSGIGAPTTIGLKYRLNRSSNWSDYIIDTVVILTNVGDYVQFKNTASTLSPGDANYAQFIMTGQISASGNMQSMVNRSKLYQSKVFSKFI